MKQYAALADWRRHMESLNSPQLVTIILEDHELSSYKPYIINLIIDIYFIAENSINLVLQAITMLYASLN